MGASEVLFVVRHAKSSNTDTCEHKLPHTRTQTHTFVSKIRPELPEQWWQQRRNRYHYNRWRSRRQIHHPPILLHSTAGVMKLDCIYSCVHYVHTSFMTCKNSWGSNTNMPAIMHGILYWGHQSLETWSLFHSVRCLFSFLLEAQLK